MKFKRNYSLGSLHKLLNKMNLFKELTKKVNFNSYFENYQLTLFRSSLPEVFCDVGVYRNFTKFLQTWACNLIKKETLAQVFCCEFCEISENTFLIDNLWWLLLFNLTMNDCNCSEAVVQSCSAKKVF